MCSFETGLYFQWHLNSLVLFLSCCFREKWETYEVSRASPKLMAIHPSAGITGKRHHALLNIFMEDDSVKKKVPCSERDESLRPMAPPPTSLGTFCTVPCHSAPPPFSHPTAVSSVLSREYLKITLCTQNGHWGHGISGRRANRAGSECDTFIGSPLRSSPCLRPW